MGFDHPRVLPLSKFWYGESRVTQPAILQFFAYTHLPEHLQTVSVPFHDMAQEIANTLPDNAERYMALRKLLEAKDCAVRSLLYKE
jgi:hypothetical protein